MRISDWSADVCSSDLRVRYFMRIGGDATVRSYWRDGASYAAATFEEVAERLPHLVPEAPVQFLGMGEDVVEIGEDAFVHDGIRPGVTLDKQALTYLRWISEELLAAASVHGKMLANGRESCRERGGQEREIT